MRKRRRREPDKRLDWRSPDMKVVRQVFYGNSHFARAAIEEVDPKEVQEQAIDNMSWSSNPLTPHYSRDPTYNLQRERK